MAETNGNGGSPTKGQRVKENLLWLGKGTPVPLVFVGFAISLTVIAVNCWHQQQEKDKAHDEHFEQVERDLSDVRKKLDTTLSKSDFAGWTRELRPGLPIELRGAIPEAPR